VYCVSDGEFAAPFNLTVFKNYETSQFNFHCFFFVSHYSTHLIMFHSTVLQEHTVKP